MDPRDETQDLPGDHDLTGPSAGVAAQDGTVYLTLHEEHARIGVERVATERVVVRKRIVEEERTITVPVRREIVEIVQEPLAEGAAPAAAEDLDHLSRGLGEPAGSTPRARHADEDHLEVLVRSEEPVVSLETVVVERVVVTRTRGRHEISVPVELAREELETGDALLERLVVDRPDWD